MAEDRKIDLAQIDQLPDTYKSYILGYAAGVIDAKAEQEAKRAENNQTERKEKKPKALRTERERSMDEKTRQDDGDGADRDGHYQSGMACDDNGQGMM